MDFYFQEGIEQISKRDPIVVLIIVDVPNAKRVLVNQRNARCRMGFLNEMPTCWGEQACINVLGFSRIGRNASFGSRICSHSKGAHFHLFQNGCVDSYKNLIDYETTNSMRCLKNACSSLLYFTYTESR